MKLVMLIFMSFVAIIRPFKDIFSIAEKMQTFDPAMKISMIL